MYIHINAHMYIYIHTHMYIYIHTVIHSTKPRKGLHLAAHIHTHTYIQSFTQQSRAKDYILQALIDSEGGADQVASFALPMVKERPMGVTGEQVFASMDVYVFVCM